MALLLALSCLRDSIVNFIELPTASGDAESSGLLLSYAIWYLIVALASFGALIPAIIIGIIRMRNGKSLMAPSILLAVVSPILLLAMTIIGGVTTGKIIETYQKLIEEYTSSANINYMKQIDYCERVIGAQIVGYVFSFFSPLVACALSVLSFFDFDKNPMPRTEAPKKASKASGYIDLERIKELKALFDSGALDEEEFKTLKSKELNIR